MRGEDPLTCISRVIDTLGDIYNAIEPCLAHGDFVPVNVLLAADGSLAGVLDLGVLADRPPVARRRVVGLWSSQTFHPEAWMAAWPSMLASAGVPSGDDDREDHSRARGRPLPRVGGDAKRSDGPAAARSDRRAAISKRDHGCTIRAMGPDILIILLVILVLVVMWRGPKTLPKIGEALGRGVKEAKAEAKNRPGRDPGPSKRRGDLDRRRRSRSARLTRFGPLARGGAAPAPTR